MYTYQRNNYINSFQKNILVIGKTGQGKSYLSNLLLQLNPQKQKNAKFPVYNKLESGTKTCQAETNQTVKYGNETINLNILDTPGIFDTKDDASKEFQYQNKPQSIINIENLDLAASRKPFEKKFNKILLVFSASEKFDIQQKALLEQLKIMVGSLKNIALIITKCQQKYDENESDEYNLNLLATYKNTVENYFKQYEITDVYFITNKPITFYLEALDQVGKFYKQQWSQLYKSIQFSSQIYVKLWSPLSNLEKNLIGKFFHYRIGQTEEQKQLEHSVQVKSQQAKYDQNDQQHQNKIKRLSDQAIINQTKKIQNWMEKYKSQQLMLQRELEEYQENFVEAQKELIEDFEECFREEKLKLQRQYR